MRYLCSLIALAACTDATEVSTPTAQAGPPPPTVGAPADDDPGRPALGARELVLVGDARIVVRPGDVVELAVDYIDDERAPIADAAVTGQVLSGEATMGARRVQTGIDGRAFLRVAVGGAGRVRVEAAAADAASVYWELVVARGGTGDLVIEVDGVAAERGTAQLYPSPMCEAVGAGRAGAPHLEAGIFDGRGRIPELADGALLTVAVRVHGPSGATVAAGCVDGIEVVGGATARAVVPVAELLLQAKGRYLVDHAFELGHLVGADRDGVVDTVARIGGGIDGSRGRAIVSLVCDHAEINAFICSGLRAMGGPVIDEIIDRQVDPRVLRALTALGDVYRIIRSPLVEAEIEVTAQTVDADGVLANNVHRFTGVRFVWRDGCEARRPADCERGFELRDLGLRGEPPRAVFDMRLDGDALELAPHTIELPLSQVALAVAEQWVLPATLGRAGPVDLESLMRELLPCRDIAANIAGGLLSEALCDEVLPGALAELVGERLGDTGGVELLSLSGHAQVWDDDGDRRVDAITRGEWTGAVRGSFEGCRDGVDCR